MPGRKKQPLSVIQGKGKSHHLTKDEIAKRKEQEELAKGFNDNIEIPSYLTAAQKREFEKISKELIRLDIFSNLDVDALARYIDSKSEYIKLKRDMKKIKRLEKVEKEDGTEKLVVNDDHRKLLKDRNLLFSECRAAAGDLGLTITSRLKLVIPKIEDDKPKSEFEKKFGDV